MTRQFREFFDLIIWRDFDNWPNCGAGCFSALCMGQQLRQQCRLGYGSVGFWLCLLFTGHSVPQESVAEPNISFCFYYPRFSKQYQRFLHIERCSYFSDNLICVSIPLTEEVGFQCSVLVPQEASIWKVRKKLSFTTANWYRVRLGQNRLTVILALFPIHRAQCASRARRRTENIFLLYYPRFSKQYHRFLHRERCSYFSDNLICVFDSPESLIPLKEEICYQCSVLVPQKASI